MGFRRLAFALLLAQASLLVPAAPASAATLACGGLAPTILGTSAAEYIVGTAGDDVIMGQEGDDTIRGLAGNDVVCGGKGDDLLNGGLGNDRVFGDPGNEAIQMSDPWVYCSTSQDDFASVSTAYRNPSDPAFAQCDPAGGALASAVKVPDGANKAFYVTIPQPLPGTNLIRDVNVRVYVTSPVVDGSPNPCELGIGILSPTGVSVSLASQNCNSPSSAVRDFSGTTFDSEAVWNIRNTGGTTLALNGRFHPSGSLDSYYRNKPVCSAASCTWKLTVSDAAADGATASVSWWALEINYGTDEHDGSDQVTCGYGANDTVDYTARNQAVNVDLGTDAAVDGQAGENDNVAVGGDVDRARCEWLYTGFGNDTLIGNSRYNDIRGSQGNDSITGLGGNDRFRGGEGDDHESGGPGDDKLDGNNGSDTLDGGDGTDRCLNGESRTACESTT